MYGPGQYVEPFGLATLSLLIVTFCFGFFMKKNPKLLLKWHKRLAYVTIMTIFATTLKRATGLDLYRKPFWQGHARWRQWCWPPYAEWMGFGDHSERWAGSWHSNANLVDTISRETESDAFTAYVQAFREEANKCPDRANMKTPAIAT